MPRGHRCLRHVALRRRDVRCAGRAVDVHLGSCVQRSPHKAGRQTAVVYITDVVKCRCRTKRKQFDIVCRAPKCVRPSVGPTAAP